MKRLLFLLFLVVIYRSASAQCSVREINLSERVNASDLIVEGKVISQNSFWNDEHNMIYTSNEIEVYKVFKGSISPVKIEVLTLGGTVGLKRITVEPSLEVNIGDIGIFTCETVKRFQLPAARKSSVPVFEAFASAQGFIKYNLEAQTASDPFYTYTDIENEVYQKVLSPSLSAWIEIAPFDINNNQAAQKNTLSPTVSSITSFSPSSVTAGTKTTITITGSGFGSTQGSGTVGFKNADDGGATYVTPLATQYISWSNTQIVVEVPDNAGTGTIQVTQGSTFTSSAALTIDYAHMNVNYDPGSGTFAYQTDHIDNNGSGGYTWQMNTAFDADASANASFLRAFDSWRCATGVNWTIGSTTSVNDAVSDGVNVICFDNTAPLSAGILGVCYSYWSGCASGQDIVWFVDELDIIFDEGSNITPLTWEYGTALPSSNEYDFETVAVHELGHGHQLGHVISPGAIMHYAISNGTSNRSLGTNDLAGGNAVQARSIVANSCGPGAMTNHSCGSAPIAAFSGSPATICAGSSVSFTDQSTNNPTSWSWTFTGGTPSSSTSQNPTVTYSAPGSYAVSLTATNSSGSDVETINGYITVNAKPSASTTKSNVSCNGGNNGSAAVTASGGAGGYSYSWSPSGGTSSTASSLSAGNYTCTVTDANSCSATASVSITQPNALTVSASGSGPICVGSSVNLTASSTGGTGSVTYIWAPGNLTGSSVNDSPGATTTYTVTGTDANGCADNATASVTVNSIPTVAASASPSSISSGSSSTLTGSGATSYSWMPGSLSGSAVNVSPTSTTTYTVTGTTSGCSNTATVAVTVTSAGVTKLQNAYCGITLSTLNQTLHCDAVTGATNYRYEITDPSNNVVVHTRGNYLTSFAMSWVTSVGYNKTYSVRVAAYVGGTWSAYGTACNVTTPPDPTTKLGTAYCGITETSLSQILKCDAVIGATNYRYEITDPSNNVVVYTRGNYLTTFAMSWVSSIGYNKTYSIRVAAYVGGTWLPYGSACTVTTPAEPATKLVIADCGITETALDQVLHCDAVVGASNYRYEITDPSNNVVVHTRGNYLTTFFMSWVSSVCYNKTYSIRVAAYVGGTWLPYGPVCTVTTPAEPTTQLQSAYCNITLSSLSQTLYCDAITGATKYRYQITNTSTNTVYTYIRQTNLTNFAMSWVSGITAGQTYSVVVAANVGGVWLPYGSACLITTPAAPLVQYNANDNAKEASNTVPVVVDEQLEVSVYPNPTAGRLNVKSNQAVMSIQIYSPGGILIKSENGNTSTDLNDLPSGCYFIVVQTEKGIKRLAVIRE